MHSAQVTLTNTDKTQTTCYQKEVKWRHSASLHGAWLYLAYFLQSIRQESQDNRDHLQLKDIKSGILPPDHNYTQQCHCTQSDRKAAARLVFLEADANFSAESWFLCRPWLRKVKMSQTTRKLHNCRTRMYSTPSHITWKGENQPSGQKHTSGKYPCQLSVENIFCLTLLRLWTGFRWRLRENLPAYWHWHFPKCLQQRGSVSCILTTLRLCIQYLQCDDQTESGLSFFFFS